MYDIDKFRKKYLLDKLISAISPISKKIGIHLSAYFNEKNEIVFSFKNLSKNEFENSFMENSDVFGYDKSLYGKKIKIDGKNNIICGFDPSRLKNPIIIMNEISGNISYIATSMIVKD